MKKFLLLATLVSFVMITKAQDFHYGIFAGASLNNMKIATDLYLGSDIDNCRKQMTVGFQFGSFAEYSFNKHLGIQAELSYSQYGYRLDLEQETTMDLEDLGSMTTTVLGNGRTSTKNINLVLMFKYYMLNKHLAIDLGVQPNWITSVMRHEEGSTSITFNGEVMSEESTDTTFHLKRGTEFHPFNFSIIGGATYYINKNIFVSARYIFGLKDIFIKEVGYIRDEDYVIESIDQLSKNRVIQLSLGWRF